MNSVLSVLKKGLKSTDFFYSTHFLRFQKQNEHRTVTGGFISLGIIVVIIAGFARMIFDTFSLNTIAYTNQIQKETVPSQTILANDPQKYSMFAIQISNAKSQPFNLSSPVKYFDLVAIYTTFYDGIQKQEIVQLQGCTREHWKTMQNLVQDFDKLGVSNWLCPKMGQNISLKGKYGSKAGGNSFMQIKGKPCSNQTEVDRKCATTEQIGTIFYQNEFTMNGKVFFINTIINPNQPSYLSYYVEDKAYFSFTVIMGSEIYLQFSSYDIETDNSIWPFSSIKKDEGYIAQDSPTIYPFFRFRTQATQYFTFNFVKSDNKFHYKRQVQKISEVFSYIGGLIGAIIAFLFIVNSFTNYSYQVVLASSIFSLNKQIKTHRSDLRLDQQQNQKQSVPSPNIFQFIKSGIYEFFSQMKKSPNWPGTERISEYRKEILNQLNIKSILNRLIFIEFCLEHLFESYELCQLQQVRPVDPKRVKQIRQKMDGEKANNISDVDSFDNPKQPREGINISQNRLSFNSNRNIQGNDMGVYKITITNPDDKANLVVSSISSIKAHQLQLVDEKDSAWLETIGKGLEERKSFKLLKSQHQKGDKKSSRILKTIISHNKQIQFSKQKQQLKLLCMDENKKGYLEQQHSNFSQIPVDHIVKPPLNPVGQNQ